ncbi:MAG: flagellar export protein FliJ [Nitrospira sp.]|nr:flagellar export protein FliJ [Nitrospira sp.]
MSLDSLRRLKERAEEAVMMELAQITRDLAGMECRCDALTDQLESDAAAFLVHAEQGMAIEAMLEWQGRMDNERAAVQRSRRRIAELTDRWKQAQARLLVATQERKVLDRLAERQEAAHRADIQRREQRATDEAATRLRLWSGKGLS